MARFRHFRIHALHRFPDHLVQFPFGGAARMRESIWLARIIRLRIGSEAFSVSTFGDCEQMMLCAGRTAV